MDPPLWGGKRCGWWMWEAGLGSLESAFQRQSDFDLWDNRGTPARANARGFTLMPKTGKNQIKHCLSCRTPCTGKADNFGTILNTFEHI